MRAAVTMLCRTQKRRSLGWFPSICVLGIIVLADSLAVRTLLMPVPISQWGSGEWLTFGVIALTLLMATAVAYLQVDFQIFSPQRQRRRREEELNDPIDFHFLIPERSQRSIEYAAQDDEEHLLNEIIIPPDTTTLVELRLHPKIKFVTTHLIFGCSDDGTASSRQRKPHPIRLADVYGQGLIESGSQPRVTAGHVVNSRFQYRWNHELRWDGHSSIIIGVQIDSHATGEYIFSVMLVGDELEKSKELIMRVEKPSNAMLICANGDHSRHSIATIFERQGAP
jgi:hypothetical protein